MSARRAFIAIELSASVQDVIQKQTARLREALGESLVRWIPAGNIHLTLKFLGDLPASHVDFIKQMLSQEAAKHRRFDLQLGGLGAFPNSNQPRVLWLGLQASPALSALQRDIEAAAERLGYQKEQRAFSPHLTLGRTRQGLAAMDLQKISLGMASVQLGRIAPARVDSVHLFKSDLGPAGPLYTKLFSATLKTAA